MASYQHRVYRPDGSFWVREFRDDVARTVTTYNEAGTVTATRPYTTTENTTADDDAAATLATTKAATLAADTTADLVTLMDAINALALLLAADTTVGSIRNIMGPAAATAGTTSLRALKAQSSAAVVTAASVKGLIDASLNLAQLAVNDAQATRRIARQVLRLARAYVGDYTSTDVGAP